MREIGHFIGGKPVKGASGRQGDVFNPNTGEVQVQVPASIFIRCVSRSASSPASRRSTSPP
jgi:acyl-CoA reductase-like NAD-dependent aldehyde dehydrogenase